MHVNPYAAPAGAGSHQGPPGQGEPQPWDVGDVIKTAWRLFAPVWLPLTGGFFVMTLIGMIPQQLPRLLVMAGVLDEQSTTLAYVALACGIVAFVIGQFFGVGFTRAVLRVARTGEARFADFFSGAQGFLPYFALTILLGIGIALGLVVFVVPGIILMLGTMIAQYYVVDQAMGPIEAIKTSWAATDGHKGALFVYWLASIAVGLLGLLACCIGYLPAFVVISLGMAIIYLRLAGLAQGTPSDAMAGGPAPPPPAAPPPAAASPWGLYGPPGGLPPSGGPPI
jgi:hypothetical protein